MSGQGIKNFSKVAVLLTLTTGLTGCGFGGGLRDAVFSSGPAPDPFSTQQLQPTTFQDPINGLFGLQGPVIQGQGFTGQGFVSQGVPAGFQTIPGVQTSTALAGQFLQPQFQQAQFQQAQFQQAQLQQPQFQQPQFQQTQFLQPQFQQPQFQQSQFEQTQFLQPQFQQQFQQTQFRQPQTNFPAQGLLPNAVAGYQQAAPQYQVSGAAWGQQPAQSLVMPAAQISTAPVSVAPVSVAPVSVAQAPLAPAPFLPPPANQSAPFDPYAYLANQYRERSGAGQPPLAYPQSAPVPGFQPSSPLPDLQAPGSAATAFHTHTTPPYPAPFYQESPYPATAYAGPQPADPTRAAVSGGSSGNRPFCADMSELNGTIGLILSRVGVAPQLMPNRSGIKFEIPFKPTPRGGKSVANAEFVMPTIAGFVSAYPTLFVQVIGHTPDTGRDRLELDYTNMIASRIGKQVINSGVDAGRVQTRGFGSRKASPFGNDDRAEFRIVTAQNCLSNQVAYSLRP